MEKLNILYVDDEENNLISFKAAFRRHYNVFVANSAKEGLETLRNNHIQVVVTDQKMPETTGVEFLEKIVPEYPDTIRMILTGYSDIEAIIQAINTGRIYRYITKPWDEKELKMTFDGAFKLYGVEESNRRLLKQLQDKIIEQDQIIEERTGEIRQKSIFLELQNQEIGHKNKDITDSIHYAKRIQEAILPPEKIVAQKLPASFILYKPKDIVSGDFYWVEEKNGKIYVAAVDCTGHGVPGAFMSIVCNNLLNQALHEHNKKTPAEILDEVNILISEVLRQTFEDSAVRDGMDISLCCIDFSSNTIEYAGAINPVYLIKKGQLSELPGNRYSIGTFVGEEIKPFTNHQVSFEKNDLLILFTDGFADQFGGPAGKKFKFKQLQDLLTANCSLDCHVLKQLLEKQFELWKGGLEQVDDVCIIGVRL
jgi:sigma-B regulation protein RsbU (phosphoserine phosphatase)